MLDVYKAQFILRRIALIAIWGGVSALNVFGQCDEPPATPTCEDAPILCNFNEIDGFCTTTKPFNNFMAPNPLCPNGGAPHNPFWFAFYAGCTELEVTISPSNCGAAGIQAAIYGYPGDGLCTGSQDPPSEYIFCQGSPCFNTPIKFFASGMTIGKIYYFMIDGCSGDTCTIEISVDTDCGPPEIGPWPGAIDGPSPVCATGTANYSVPAPSGGTYFYWYLDGVLYDEGGVNNVDVTFPGPGVYQLCVDVSNQCVSEFENPTQLCRTINVYEIVPVNPPPVTICHNDTYTYGGQQYGPGVHEVTLQTNPYNCDSIVTLTVNGFIVTNAVNPPDVLICEDATYNYAGQDYGPGVYDVVLKNFMNCDSIVTLTINPDPHVTEDLGTFIMCADDTIRIGGQKWFGDPPGEKEITIKKSYAPFCDSTIRFLIEPLLVEAYIFEPDVLGCDIEQVYLDGSSGVYSPSDAEVTYEWFAYDGGILGDTPDASTMWVVDTGKYCLVMTVTSPDGMYSCSDSACVKVTSIDEPHVSAWVNDSITCNVPVVTLTGTSKTAGVSYQWFNPQGLVMTTDTMTTTSTPGTYRFVVTDQFGCPNTAQVVVISNLTKPDVSGTGGTITCASPTVDLVGQSNTPGASFLWKDAMGNTIGNTPTIQAPGPGTFNLIVTNPVNGCPDSVNVVVDQNTTLPVPTASTQTLTCLLPNPPLNGSSNVPNATYTWSFGGNVYSYQKDTVAHQSGNFTLSVFNPDNGCIKDTIITVPEDTAAPDISAVGDSMDCIKTIGTLTGSSATPGAAFQWFFGGAPFGSGPVIQVTLPGIYTLQVTGQNGCTSTTNAEAVLDILIPDIQITGSDDTLTCLVTDIQLTGSSNMPVDWSWTNSGGQIIGTSSALNVQQPDTYTLTITALNGCTNSMDIVIPQDIVPPVISLVQGGVIDCSASSIMLQAVSPTPGVTYQWYNPGGSPLPAGPQPSVSAPGQYTLIVTAYNGCTATSTAVVSASPDLPQGVTATNDGAITCSKTAAVIQSSSTTTGVTYQWSGPGGFNCNTPNCNVLIPGTYTVTVTNPANSCTIVDFTTVVIDTIHPIVTPSGNLITCYDPSVPISVASVPPSGVTYAWQDPSGQPFGGNSSMIQVMTPGSWTVVVTNNTNDCATTSQVNVTANTTQPNINIPPPAVLTCVVLDVILTNSPSTAVQYNWSGPGINAGNQTSSQPQVSMPGTYQVTITDPVNGCTNTNSITVDQQVEDPVLSLSGGVLTCTSPSLTLTASSIPSNNISAQWLRDGMTIPGQGLTNTINQAGTYTLIVTNNANGCSSEIQVSVTADQTSPDLSVTGGELTCLDPLITISGNSATPGLQWSWSGPGGFTGTQAAVQVSIPGLYTLTATAANGCTTQEDVIVTEQKTFPTAVAGSSNILDCTNPTTTLNATGSSSGPEMTYTWLNTTGQVIGMQSTVGGISVPGAYSLVVTNTINGCSSTATVVVQDNPNMPSGITVLLQDPNCHGFKDGFVQVAGVTGGTPPYLYSLNGGPLTPNAQFNGLGGGQYIITIQDAAGCVYTAPAYDLVDPEQLTVELGDDFILQWGQDTFLYALILPPTAVLESIIWTPQGIDTTMNTRDLYIKPFNQTLYGVVVTDDAGCKAEDKVLVLVEKRRPVYIPNVFHPDGDQNTRFYIQTGEGITEIEAFEVFNRWGELVYSQFGFQPNDPSLGWDGYFRGKPANPEVYVYYARVRFNDGISLLYKGDVVLVK